MILADKIIQLRKKCGWSQEELAEKMKVSRQAVSKWEGAQSTPDLEKILRMSALFGVSTDYLLKDELEESGPVAVADDSDGIGLRWVSMEQAAEFLALRRWAAGRIARGVALCIMAPVLLLLAAVLAEQGLLPLSENRAVALGFLALFALVALAVQQFITTGNRCADYEFLEKEAFETAYGVEGMVRQTRERQRPDYERGNVQGVLLCILSVVPLICGGLIWENEVFLVAMLCLMLALCAAGVYRLVSVGVAWAATEKLLQEGEYSRAMKRRDNSVGAVYWPLVTAGYLLWSFLSGDWHLTWVVWPISGVVYGPVAALWERLRRK